MTGFTQTTDAGDPFNLGRFLSAQAKTYPQALTELERGQKQSHWMWYIFPQIHGLGLSQTSRHYAIKNIAEARAYLEHPVLGPRLLSCVDAVLRVEGRTAAQIFGSPDDLKLKSCATLFTCVGPAGGVFDRLLQKYYGGHRDAKTLALLSMDAADPAG